jgi:P-type Ca2+ transporter type 2C
VAHPYYSADAGEVLETLKATDSGLSSKEAAARRKQYGPNTLKKEKPKSLFRIFLEQINNPVIYLLSAAAAMAFIFKDAAEGIAIVVVIFLNTAIGFWMEVQARKSMRALRAMDTITATVLRDGRREEIDADRLVPGDVIIAEAGDIIPADARILEAYEFRVDESPLTGESMPVTKSPESVHFDAPLGDRSCMLYKGTSVTGGNGTAVVTGTGMNTELGEISELVSEAEQQTVPLNRKLRKLTRSLIWFIVFLAAAFFIVGWLAGKDWYVLLQTSIAWTIAAIPEGLPIVASIALARGMLHLSRQHVIVKRLESVETLGEITAVCTDKTGTLTENRLAVRKLLLPGIDSDVTVDNTFQIHGFENYPEDPRFDHIFSVSRLCNNAVITETGHEDGDPLEISLLHFTAGVDRERDRKLGETERIAEDPFDSESKFMGTVHRLSDGSEYMSAKGSAEAILERSDYIETREGVREITDEEKEDWLSVNDRLSGEGLRVLAFAYRKEEDLNIGRQDQDFVEAMVFTGLAGFIDPPRDEIPSAMEVCRSAGIRPVMVTGDHPATARAVAEEVGIAEEADIFSRVDPKEKLEIVRQLQESGEIVAMTGDGVNDAPALKRADIGIAMGERGTQVARETADMVLTDDSFPSILTAVRQGRVIFSNIRKFIMYQLSYHLAEIVLIAAVSFTLFRLPILPLQLLFLNLLSDVFPALALGLGKGPVDVMNHPPKDPEEPIMTRRNWISTGIGGLVIASCVIGIYFIAHFAIGFSESMCNSVAFFSLAIAQLLHVFDMRDDSEPVFNNQVTRNRYVWGALALCAAVLAAAYLLPAIRGVLSFRWMGLEGWLLVLASSFSTILVLQTVKGIRKLISDRSR